MYISLLEKTIYNKQNSKTRFSSSFFLKYFWFYKIFTVQKMQAERDKK